MIVGTILLTQQDEYVSSRGFLPARPKFDKRLLQDLCTGRRVSEAGKGLLPPSILNVLNDVGEFIPITIRELANADLLIVVRSEDTTLGLGSKVFRFDDFSPLIKTKEIELWLR